MLAKCLRFESLQKQSQLNVDNVFLLMVIFICYASCSTVLLQPLKKGFKILQ